MVEDSADKKIEREEAKRKKEERERQDEERRQRHESNQSMIQLAIVRACTG